MPSENLNIVITAQDQASQVFRDLGRETNTLVTNVTRGLAQGAGMAVFNQAAQLAGEAFHFATEAVIGFNASLEQSRIAWATMLGGAAQANTMLANLQQFAATTPFEFPDVERAGKRLLAMGFAARDIIPLLTDVGNASSALGLGVEGIDRITLALGQMSSRTKVSAQDMLQLTEVGVPAWRILAEAMGTSIAQVQDAAEKGVIPAQTFITAFQQFSRTNFGGLMDQQSRTFVGALSNIRDQLRIVSSSAFQPLFEALSRLLQQFAEFTQSQAVRDFGNGFREASIGLLAFIDVASRSGPILEGLKAALIGIAGVLAVQFTGAVLVATRSLAIMVGSIAVAALPWTLLAAAIAGAAVIIIANWDQLADAAGQVTAAISEKWAGLAEWFTGTFAPAISSIAGSIWEGFANPAIEALNAISDAWSQFWNQEIGATGQTAFQQLQELAREGWGNFVDVALNALESVVSAWNELATRLQSLKEANVPLLGIWGQLAGKTIDVTRATDGLRGALNEIPGIAINAGTEISKFVATELPAAMQRTVEFLQAAGASAADFAPQLQAKIGDLLNELNSRLAGGAVGTGKQVGQALVGGITSAIKPLAEELNRLLTQQLATPAQQALEDTQAQIERNRLVIANVRGASPEERSRAIRENVGLGLNVLPQQQLAAFDVSRQVTLAQRAEQAAQLAIQIAQHRVELGLQGAAGGLTTAPTLAPVGVTGGPVAAAAQAPIQIPLTVNVNVDGSTTVFQQLIEANQQAQTPPPITLSGVRR